MFDHIIIAVILAHPEVKTTFRVLKEFHNLDNVEQHSSRILSGAVVHIHKVMNVVVHTKVGETTLG